MSLQSSQVLRAMGLAVSVAAFARPGYAQVAQPSVDDLPTEQVISAVIRDFKPKDKGGPADFQACSGPAESNFRVETTLTLRTVTAPGTTAMYD